MQTRTQAHGTLHVCLLCSRQRQKMAAAKALPWAWQRAAPQVLDLCVCARRERSAGLPARSLARRTADRCCGDRILPQQSWRLQFNDMAAQIVMEHGRRQSGAALNGLSAAAGMNDAHWC